MRLRIAPKIVLRVFTVLTLSASLVYASVSADVTEEHEHVPNRKSGNVDDRPLSPRLAALRDRIKSGDRTRLISSGRKSANKVRRLLSQHQATTATCS